MRSSQSHDAYFNASNIKLDYSFIAGTQREPRSHQIGSQYDIVLWSVFVDVCSMHILNRI
jgi:hypothetical protein